MAGNVLKLASLDQAVEYAVGFLQRDFLPVASQACWPASRRLSMMATFQSDEHLTACFKNNLTGTFRCNNINSISTNVAHQTEKWCFDSSS